MPRPRQAKHIASVSLGVMGAGFLATMPLQGHTFGNLLQGGFEAGLVGGLADWFAVTALFRHPLGIPIPHTALLPKNRERVVQALISAIENDFLTKASIQQKITQIRIGEKLVGLLEQHMPEVTRLAVRLSEKVVRNVPIDRIVPLISAELTKRLKAFDSASILRFLQEQIIARGYEKNAILFVLDKAEDFVRKEKVKQNLGEAALKALENVQMGGFMGFAIGAFAGFMSEEKLGGLLQNMLLTNIRDMKVNSANPLRTMLLDEWRRVLSELPSNPQMVQALDNWKERLPEEWKLEEKLHGWLLSIQNQVLAYVQEERFAQEFVQPMLGKLIDELKANPETLQSLEQWIHTQVFQFVEDNHSKIGKMVKENLDKLDNKTLITMMEDKIGKDIQWIRVNGAVCGFLIGVVLTGVRMLF